MTTADRVDAIKYRSWVPGTVVLDDEYIGKHRRPGFRLFSLRAMLHVARHRQL
ncbi:MAG: hypothetical protein QOE97_142 [Pseudonocardiales bacterium]|nr:hypothetical protein [Pseudonocardiales bacterium]